jgi:glycosyltransferase involved in cell wall biosynthesis
LVWSLMRERHRRAELNLATSTVTLQDLEKHGIRNLALWERAVDSHLFRPDARTAEMRNRLSGGEPDKPLLLYVGRLSAEKEVAKLREVTRAVPEVRLAIVGDGPVRHELEKHFEGMPAVFTGYMRGEMLASAYASADLFVFPSQTETLGLVLLESMASGCPVVACNAGGIPDAVQDGVTGFLFEAGDPDGLVNTVKRALSEASDLDSIRVRARQDVEQHSWEGATEQLRGLYAQAVHNRLTLKPNMPEGRLKRVTSRVTLSALRTFLP